MRQPQASVDPPPLSAPLLAVMRRRLGRPDLAYQEEPTLLATGTEAWILALSLRGLPTRPTARLVLRAMFASGAQPALRAEHAVQDAVAAQGFPAPRVLLSDATGAEIGRPYMVMERLPGAPQLQLPDAIEQQAAALARLHALDPSPISAAARTNVLPPGTLDGPSRSALATAQVERWGLDGYRPLLEWLRSSAPEPAREAICHGDPHLHNLLFDDGSLSGVIDWGAARLDRPELDVGLVCGYARAARTPADAEAVIGRLTRAYERHRPLDRAALRWYETEFLVSVLVDMADRAVRRAAGEVVEPNPMLDHARTVGLVGDRLRAVTGLPIPKPPEVTAGR